MHTLCEQRVIKTTHNPHTYWQNCLYWQHNWDTIEWQTLLSTHTIPGDTVWSMLWYRVSSPSHQSQLCIGATGCGGGGTGKRSKTALKYCFFLRIFFFFLFLHTVSHTNAFQFPTFHRLFSFLPFLNRIMTLWFSSSSSAPPHQVPLKKNLICFFLSWKSKHFLCFNINERYLSRDCHVHN